MSDNSLFNRQMNIPLISSDDQDYFPQASFQTPNFSSSSKIKLEEPYKYDS